MDARSVTPQTALELEFGDGAYLFDLKLPQLAELQEKRGAGVFAIYARLLKGRYIVGGVTIGAVGEADGYVEDCFETIRLGLIGGGRGLVDGREVQVSALTAKRLVEAYCHPAPLQDAWSLAAAILGARVQGYTPPKVEPADAPEPDAAGETTGSTSASPSPTAPSSDAIGGS